jgi:hypothetical protein
VAADETRGRCARILQHTPLPVRSAIPLPVRYSMCIRCVSHREGRQYMTACHVVDDEGGASPGGGEVHENTVYAFYREGCLCAHTSLPVRCVVYTPCVPYREGCLCIQYTPFPVRHTLRIYTVRIAYIQCGQGGIAVPFRGGTGYSYIVSHRGVYYTVRGVGIVNCILYTPPCVTRAGYMYGVPYGEGCL